MRSIELPPPPEAERGAAPLAAESGAPIHGTLRLAAELQGAQPSGAVLFLIARTAAAGPPLAVKRIEAPRFPLDFEIGPADRMLATMPFAGAIQLSARLDSDGNATSRTPGDLTGRRPARPSRPARAASRSCSTRSCSNHPQAERAASRRRAKAEAPAMPAPYPQC